MSALEQFEKTARAKTATMYRELKRALLLASVGVVFMIVLGVSVVFAFLADQKNDGRNLHTAGYQLTLAEELHKNAHSLLNASEEERAQIVRDIEKTRKDLVANHYELEKSRFEDSGKEDQAVIMLHKIEPVLTQMVQIAAEAEEHAHTSPTSLKPIVLSMEESGDAYREHMGELVSLLKKEVSSRSSDLQWILIALSLITFVVLGLEGVFILRPAVGMMDGHINGLVQQGKELEGARIQAESSSKSKGEFLANTSHELRTPLTAILGFSEILLERDLGDDNHEKIATIHRHGSLLLELINDILDLSKIEAGKFDIEKIEFNLCEVVKDIVGLMRVRAESKSISLSAEYNGSIPRYVVSDPTRIRQILINLVGNAIKFTEKGGVRIVVSFQSGDEHKAPRLRFDVIDTGVGIPEDKLGRLFKAFSQVDSSTSRKFGGTGLGLDISKRLSKMLHGDITVQSTLGVGSTFSLEIDVDATSEEKLFKPATGMGMISQVSKNAAQGKDPGSILAGSRVLLAEDSPDNRRLVSFFLEKAGAEVEMAENGQEACEKARNAVETGMEYDVILMDVQMPVLDGYEATQRLRASGYTGTIVALTAHAMSGMREECISVGCNDYATKPIKRKELIAIVDKYSKKSAPAVIDVEPESSMAVECLTG